MKKILTLVAIMVFAVSANAEKLYTNTRFFDNWSIGVNGGVNHNLGTAHWPMGGVYGLHLDKECSPEYGLTFEVMANSNGLKTWGFEKSVFGQKRVIDGVAAFAMGRVNLMNLFGGYIGHRRIFEIEGTAGVGYGQTFLSGYADGSDFTVGTDDYKAFMAKAGLNLNFNLGKCRAWTINVKPAVVWAAVSNYKLDRASAAAEVTAGVTYHFKNSNGTHSFSFGRGYDQAEVDALNATINGLRGTVSDKEAELAAAQRTIRELEVALNDCRNRAPIVKTVTETVTKTNSIPDVLVTFRQGKSVVDASQLPNVERVATYLNSHKDATVVIRGYASPEGSAEINAKIANSRAQAVKDILVKKYRIAESRIQAEGQGVGDMFSEPDWNRVSICTIGE